MKAAEMAAQWWADRLQTGDRERFRAVLQAKIEMGLRLTAPVVLSVDYDPQDLMFDALREAGIGCSGRFFSADGIFPRKTMLKVYADRLEPKEGYGNWTAPIQVPRDAGTRAQEETE